MPRRAFPSPPMRLLLAAAAWVAIWLPVPRLEAQDIQALRQDLEALRRLVQQQQQQLDQQAAELTHLNAERSEGRPPSAPSLADRELVRAQVAEALQELRLTSVEQTPEEKRLTTVYDDGFFLKGRDDTLRIGGWYQGDVNVFTAGEPGNTRFRNRRARLDVRGALEEQFGYRLYGEFAGSSAKLQEAWLSYDAWPFARLKLGQFKEPFSLESSYSARWIDFVERSIGVTNLQPAEDLGLMVFGKAWDGRLEYGVGLFNGRGKNTDDNNDDEDLAARMTFAPWKAVGGPLWQDLYLGASITHGKQNETFGGTGFTTAGGTRFLTFASGAAQDGLRTRYGADLQWIYGPGDVKLEWIGSHYDNLNTGAVADALDVNGWHLSASHVLTGERKRRNKPLRPARNFDPHTGSWGAWEVMGRVEQFFTQSKAFESGLVTGTNRVDAVTVGLTWWPNFHTKLMANYVWSLFDDTVVSGGVGLDSEQLALLRAQYDF